MVAFFLGFQSQCSWDLQYLWGKFWNNQDRSSISLLQKTLSLHSCKDSEPSNEFFRVGHEKTPPYDDTHFCLMKIILFKLIARTGKLVVGNPIPIPNTENRYWDQENSCIVRHIFCQVTVWKWAQKLANWRKIQVKSNDFCPCYLFFEKTFVKLMQM